jgi:glycosyltransferase involved in cell wall biosynthesis
MIQPLISVIINCYNGEKYLKQAIQSVISQTYKNWEIIFWDNQSNDNTSKIVQDFKNSKIYYHYSEKFTNLYTARNLAVKKAKGDFITFLDVDDWWDENKLEMQINVFNYIENIDIVYTNYFFINGDKSKIVYGKKSPSGKIFKNLLKDNFIGVSTLMIKSDVFNKIKFENNFHIIGDYDFTLKAAEFYNFYYIYKPLLFYRWHGNNESIKKEKLKIEELRILYKNLVNQNLKTKFIKELNIFFKKINYYECLFLIKENKFYLYKLFNYKLNFIQKTKIIIFYLRLLK